MPKAMPRQKNNRKHSTSQAQKDIPPASSTVIQENCFSIATKKLFEYQQKIIDKLMKRIRGTFEEKYYELEGKLSVTQTVNCHLESMTN